MKILFRAPALLLCALLMPLAAFAASSAAGRYELVVNGIVTALELRDEGKALRGELQESGVRIPVRGQSQGDQLTLQLIEPQSGTVIGGFKGKRTKAGLDGMLTLTDPASGKSEQRPALFLRAGTTQAPAAQASPGAGTLDARLIGRWLHEEVINSPGGAGGFASFSTRRTMVLEAQGRAEQWLESASSGGNWSTGASRKTEFTGEWKTEGTRLLLRAEGQSGFVPAGSYRFSGAYLVLEANGKRVILQRR